jgi:hypothetical protein
LDRKSTAGTEVTILQSHFSKKGKFSKSIMSDSGIADSVKECENEAEECENEAEQEQSGTQDRKTEAEDGEDEAQDRVKEAQESVNECVEDDERSPKEGEKTAIESKNAKDLYDYTKREEFTSEIYKIEICNLPRFGFKVQWLIHKS